MTTQRIGHALPVPGSRSGHWARGLKLAAAMMSLLSVAAVCVSKGGDVEFVREVTPVADGLRLVIEATRADVALFRGEPGSVVTEGEFGNRPRVVHRVRPDVILPASNLLIETHVPVRYAPRTRAILRMWIPDGTEIEVNGEEVSVTIEGPIAAHGRINLTAGDATLTDVAGDFAIETGTGGITLNRFEGRMEGSTGRGSIFLRGAPPADALSRLETGAGSIFADLSRAPALPVRAESARGAILLHDGEQPVSGSNISVSPSGDRPTALELVTANGIIDIRR